MTRLLAIAIVVAIACIACGPNQRIINSSQESQASANATSNVAPALNSFEREVNAMRNADFSFIYVFRRKDRAPLDADDKSFITRTSPPEMNRRTLADEGKAVIIGSNFRMPAASLETFKARFMFEDYSKPESQVTNSNSNE
ncbi:MAG TPA: hypothetical protein VNA22_02025 [Pyrinomonadaceae bacterium]|nr:hypothetical protein [Pyrinomonadaceae bacterium]